MVGPVIVQRIEATGPTKRARRLVFGSDPQPRTTSAAVVRVLGIDEGEPLDVDRLITCEVQCARDRALRLLSSCERSRADVVRRLESDGYPTPLVEELCDRFEELELIDDDRFSRMLVRTRIRGGYGSQRIAAELRRHGVDTTIATAALAEEAAPEADILRTLVASQSCNGPADRARIVRRMTNRGFTLAQVLEALRGAECKP